MVIHIYQHHLKVLHRIDLLLYDVDSVVESLVSLKVVLDLLDSVADGSVIPFLREGLRWISAVYPSYSCTDTDDLAGEYDFRVSLLSFQFSNRNIKVFRDDIHSEIARSVPV